MQSPREQSDRECECEAGSESTEKEAENSSVKPEGSDRESEWECKARSSEASENVGTNPKAHGSEATKHASVKLKV